MDSMVRSVSAVLACLVLASEDNAQRSRSLQADPPLRRAIPGPLQPTILQVTGDSPLTELARFSGRVDVFVQVLPYNAEGPTVGTFTVSGIPAGATIRRAWLEVTQFPLVPAQAVSVDFEGQLLGPKQADVVDPGSPPGSELLYCSLYRFDVTESVFGDGSYTYEASGHSRDFGDALVVVYEHASLPLRTLAIHDGAENLANSSTATTFADMPCTSGTLRIFTSADNTSGPEEVRLNGVTVAGPADLFQANLGPATSLVTIPVTLQAGANEMVLATTDDWFGVHLAVLSAEGVVLGFETEDDFATPLANGQALASPQEFGLLVSLASSGANAGAAIFDTTPAGPNDPSQDRDLLVERGNVLILQNSQVGVQTVPGIFDRPNDDQDGGDLTLDFTAAAAPRCLVLVDIDAGSEQASSVTLTDTLGRTRVYTVPPRWTEDLLADGAPAWRTLDLQTLAPQPGFLSVATVGQAPGFDPSNVIRLAVHLGSSGAVDDLVFTTE